MEPFRARGAEPHLQRGSRAPSIFAEEHYASLTPYNTDSYAFLSACPVAEEDRAMGVIFRMQVMFGEMPPTHM